MKQSLTESQTFQIWRNVVLWWYLRRHSSGAIIQPVIEWWRSVGWEAGISQLLQNDEQVIPVLAERCMRYPFPEPTRRQWERALHGLVQELRALSLECQVDSTKWETWFCENYAQPNCVWQCVLDATYPPLLRSIADPPAVVWWYTSAPPGEIWQQPSLAVVGSRNWTAYGRQATQYFVEHLVQQHNCVIVSGGARGVDTGAQTQAVESGGSVVVVLPSGVSSLPQATQYWLDQNKNSGRVYAVSEFPPDWPVQKWQFAQRNRVISGLAQGTLVIEARQKSGTWLTAASARTQGRELCIVSAPFTSPNASGISKLVADGATLVTSPQEVAQQLGWIHSNQSRKRQQKAPLHMAKTVLQKQILDELWHNSGRLPEFELRAQLRATKLPELNDQQWVTDLLDLEWREVVHVDRGLISLSNMVQS